MSEQTAIQWTDSTWNIVTGCTRVGPGCARCYIERTPPFRMIGRRFAMVGNESTTGVTLHWDRLLKVPRGPKVFTPSLGDLFHDEVPDVFIASAFDVMRKRPDRIFQVLTKRPERALDWFTRYAPAFERFRDGEWPLPNVWMGVSIENARYTWRADMLREIPAAVRFISAEPLLGSLYDGSRDEDAVCVPVLQGRRNGDDALSHAGRDRRDPAGAPARTASDSLAAEPQVPQGDAHVARRRAPLNLSGIDWVIIGGESGPKARPFHLEHAREIIDRCMHLCESCARAYYELELTTPPTCTGRPAIFVKQFGAKPLDGPSHSVDDSRAGLWQWTLPLNLRDRKGGDPDEWPADLRIREFPRTAVPA